MELETAQEMEKLEEYYKKEFGIEVDREKLIDFLVVMGIDACWQAYKHMDKEEIKESAYEMREMK